MLVLAGSERDVAAWDSLTAIKDLVQGGPFLTETLIEEVLRGNREAAERTLQAFETEGEPIQIAPKLIAAFVDDFDTAERLARIGIRTRELQGERVGAYIELVELLVARGRWTECARELDAAESLDRERIRVVRARLASLPHLAVPVDDLARSRSEMRAWAPPAPEPVAPPERAYERHRRQLLLGLLASKLGEVDAARAHADSLEALPAGPVPAIPTASAATIRADVAWRAGRPAAEILEILRPVEGRIPSGLWADEVFSQEHARFLRVEALHAAAEHDEALRWLEHGFVNTPGWVYYKPPVRHLKARIHEASARQDEARASREAFRVLWRDADSPLGLPAASSGATP